MNKEFLLNKIAQFKSIEEAVEQECRAFCADRTIPVAERWEVFSVAPNKENDNWDNYPNFIDSPYDDLYLEKYETFDVIKSLNSFQELVDNGKTWGSKWGRERLEEAKNHYMVQYIGSWKHNW